MYLLCMATKTISVDLIAYESLCRLRSDPRESFSKVIRRLADTLGSRPPVGTGGSAGVGTQAPGERAAEVATGLAPAPGFLASLFAEADRLWLPSEEALDRLDGHQLTPRPRREPRDTRLPENAE